jgi:hypothetical protein
MDKDNSEATPEQAPPQQEKASKLKSATQVAKSPAGEKDSNSSKKLLVIIVILLAILLLGSLGVIGYMLLKGDSSTEEDKTEESVEEDTEEEEETDDTEDEEEDTTETTVTTDCVATGFDGETYEDGDSYTTLDGCQTCSCDRGEWDCSVDPICEMDPNDCVYEGTVYNDGDTKEIDACRDRECTSGMWIIVIDSTCCEQDGTYYENGETFPSSDGCNTCTCTMGTSMCTMMLCP